MATLLFFGLNRAGHGQLESILIAQGHRVQYAEKCEAVSVDAVFCDGDDEKYCWILSGLRTRFPRVPIVVVTRNPTENKWLDALKAGAADYCSAPFEPVHVRWILQSVLPVRSRIFAADPIVHAA